MNSKEKIGNRFNKMTKNQHYVPKFYLDNFCNNEGLLTQYDIIGGQYDNRSPKVICNKNYLYDIRWQAPNEDIGKFVFANHLENEFMVREGEYSTLCKKIIGLCLNPNNKGAIICYRREKELLADFVANMFLRNPCVLDANKAGFTPSFIVEEMKKTENGVVDTIGADNVVSLVKVLRQYDFLSNNVPGGLHQQIKEIIGEMKLLFWVTKDDSFITSNNPVIVDFDEKPKRIYRSFFLPLCPKCAVLFHNFELDSRYKNKIKYISTECAYSFNRMYLELGDNVVNYLYAKNNNQVKGTLAFKP